MDRKAAKTVIASIAPINAAVAPLWSACNWATVVLSRWAAVAWTGPGRDRICWAV